MIKQDEHLNNLLIWITIDMTIHVIILLDFI